MLETLKMRYSRKKIVAKEYPLDRANLMNSYISHWKSLEASAKTSREKTLCRLMINMYLKRYIYYIYK